MPDRPKTQIPESTRPTVGKPLTRREAQVLDYIITYLAKHLYQPSLREICSECRTKSTKTASDVIQSLADKGYLDLPARGSRPARAIRLVGVTLTVHRTLL